MDLTGLGSAFDFAKGIADRFFPPKATEAERLEAVQKMVPMIEGRDDAVITAKKDIMTAELAQSDNFTKRARPTIIYSGLAFIGMIEVIFPMLKSFCVIFMIEGLTEVQLEEVMALTDLSLPTAFWAAWGSVCSVYSIGRSTEKNGVVNKMVSMITGN